LAQQQLAQQQSSAPAEAPINTFVPTGIDADGRQTGKVFSSPKEADEARNEDYHRAGAQIIAEGVKEYNNLPLSERLNPASEKRAAALAKIDAGEAQLTHDRTGAAAPPEERKEIHNQVENLKSSILGKATGTSTAEAALKGFIEATNKRYNDAMSRGQNATLATKKNPKTKSNEQVAIIHPPVPPPKPPKPPAYGPAK